MRWIAAVVACWCVVAPAEAQEADSGEIIVTATRRSDDGFSETRPAIGLRRPADFAVQPVVITGDTREAAARRNEIYATIRNAIERADRSGGIELATGELVVEPVTLANYRDLPLARDDRPDSERVRFLVKAPLGAGGADTKAVLDRITAFIKAVPVVGRALLRADGELTLSVVRPDQYRGAIADLIAADARASAARFGPDYAVEVRGLDRPVEWARASLTEVFLYLPASYSVVPARR